MPFCGYDHIDLRVSDVAAVRPFYDALMQALGLPTIVVGRDELDRPAVEYYEAEDGHSGARRFFGVHEEAGHVADATRIAFRVDSRETVDLVAAVALRAGARDFEPPSDAYAHEPYYAAFFRDPCGNRLEICYRLGSATFPPRETL